MSWAVRTTHGAHRRTALWCVGAAAIGIALMASAAVLPLLPLGIVIGLGMLALAVFRPKTFVVVGLSVIVLTVLIERLIGPIGGHADEAVVVMSLVVFSTRRFVTEGRLVWLPGGRLLLLFVALGLASSAVHHVGIATVGTALLVYVKGALYAFAVAQLRWTDRDLRRLTRFGVGAIVVISIAGLINLAVPQAWAMLTTGRPPIGYFGPIPALNGLFQHPAAMSRMCAVLAMSAFVYLIVVRTSIGPLALAAVMTGLSVLTFEVKSLLGLMAAYVLFAVRFARPAGIAAAVAFVPIVLFSAGPGIAYLVGGTVQTYVLQDSARLRLTTGAFELANEYLPLGAGFGRWGSSPAATDYSPEYVIRGFTKIFGLGPVDGQYLNDTQWPAILGEAGWFGAAAFALALILALRSLLRPIGPLETRLQRWIRLSGIAWLIVLVVESIAAPVFVSAPSFPFLLLAVGIVASMRKDEERRALEALTVAAPLQTDPVPSVVVPVEAARG